MNKNEVETDQISASPYTNITVGRIQTGQIISPTPISSRNSLSAHKRPKQKIRKPSKEFLNNKSGLSNMFHYKIKSFSCRRIRT